MGDDASLRTRLIFTKPQLAAVFTCISGFNARLSARVAFILKWFVIIESDKISSQAQKHVRGISVRIWAEISATRGESIADQLLLYTIIAREQKARKTWRKSLCGGPACALLTTGAFICRGRTVAAHTTSQHHRGSASHLSPSWLITDSFHWYCRCAY